MKRRNILYIVLAVALVAVTALVVVLNGRSDGYLNVIPLKSKALMAIDFTKLGDVKMDDFKDCGVDFSRKAYLFETSDGSLGLVAAVGSEGDVDSWLQRLADQGKASKTTERKGFKFSVINDNFIVGYSSSSLLVMGPAVGGEQAQLQRRMVKYLSSEEESVTESTLFQRLATMDGPVSLVAKADALPDKLIAHVTLGAPKGTAPDRLYIAATMDLKGECLTVSCHTFSFDSRIEDALRNSFSKLRPVSDKYLSTISSANLLTIACGVKGGDFVELLRSNESLRTMLMGINTTIDIDKMLRGVDGDLIVSVPAFSDDNIPLSLLAEAKDVSWKEDVAYWKKSCPAGSVIEDVAKNSWVIKGKQFNACFGVTDSGLLYIVPTAEAVSTVGEKSPSPLSPDIMSNVKGSPFVAILSIGSASKQQSGLSVISSFLPHLKTIVLKMKNV